MKYVCKCCGSDRIQVRAWIDANTNQAFEWCDDENYHECFCEDCQDLTEWKAIEENTNENTNAMKKEMKKYTVRIYLHTFVDVEVEAENKEMAKEEAVSKEYDVCQLLDNMVQDETDIDVEEIQPANIKGVNTSEYWQP